VDLTGADPIGPDVIVAAVGQKGKRGVGVAWNDGSLKGIAAIEVYPSAILKTRTKECRDNDP
jgi:hypothetical protein